MRVIGLDIGTTTIGASVIDGKTGEVLCSKVEQNRSFIDGGETFEKRQDPALILEVASGLIDTLCREYTPVAGIGVTGQMHGIVYVDKDGQAVSPLYTWQDGRGDQPYPGGKGSYVRTLSGKTGARLATGYGSVTHFYNRKNALVPASASTFCTIHDYVAMRLAGRTAPLMHATDAASFGLFDLVTGQFDDSAIKAAGMDPAEYPQVGGDYEELGRTKDGVPVYIAVGDNQASFLGSVSNADNAVLVNVGTGSQVSLLSDRPVNDPVLETRPYMEGKYLLVGSSLCGGRAYAMLEQFFREMVTEAGFECKSLYPVLDRMTEGFEALPDRLKFNTRFSGTRQNPDERGSVENLGIHNFTPRYFAVGVIEGTVNELYDMLSGLPDLHPDVLVGSGNGVRKGETLRKMASMKFGAPMQVPSHHEEAAYGAALCALVGCGAATDMRAAQAIIRYN